MSLDTTADDDEIDRCIACAKPFLPGDQVLSDAGGGLIHAACCGPEREGYVGADGEPLKDGESIPTPWAWQPELRKCPHCGHAVSIEPSHNAPDTLYVFACPESSPCRHSGLGTYAIASQLPQAIAAWNRRASSLSEAGDGWQLVGGQNIQHIGELAAVFASLPIGRPVVVSSQFHEAAMVLADLVTRSRLPAPPRDEVK